MAATSAAWVDRQIVGDRVTQRSGPQPFSGACCNEQAKFLSNNKEDDSEGFVASPDFNKGFKYSGRVLSHHQLEDINEKLRRRLASLLVSVTNPLRCGSGSLLANEFISLRVQDKINELGEETDRLCDACAKAKRGDSDLTRQTELMHHQVNLLVSWLEWLKVPKPFPSNEESPACVPQWCTSSTPCVPDNSMVHELFCAAAANRSAASSSLSERDVKDSAEQWQAADDAMFKLLEEEEESKRKQQAKSKKKRQKKKAKKKCGTHDDTRPGLTYAAGSVGQSHAQPSLAAESSHISNLAGCNEVSDGSNDSCSQLNSPGSQAKPRDSAQYNSVLKMLGKDARSSQVVGSTYHVLEVLKDDGNASSSDCTEIPAHVDTNKGTEQASSCLPSSGYERCTSTHQKRSTAASTIHERAGPRMSEATPSLDINTCSAQHLMALVKSVGHWEYTWLSDAITPGNPQYNAELYEIFNKLPLDSQQLVWQCIPHSKGDAKPVVSRMPASRVRPIPSSMLNFTPDADNFIKLLVNRGIRHKQGLLDALQASSTPDDSVIAAEFQSLSSCDQAAVWEMLPKVRPGSSAVSSFANPWSSFGVGYTPPSVMSRLGCRPVKSANGTLVPTVASYRVPGRARTSSSSSSTIFRGLNNSADCVDVGRSKMCVVCLDKGCDAIVLPCKHVVMCSGCAVLTKNSTGKCPVCHSNVEVIQFYSESSRVAS